MLGDLSITHTHTQTDALMHPLTLHRVPWSPDSPQKRVYWKRMCVCVSVCVCVCSVSVCVSVGYQPCIIQSERWSRKVKARPVYNTQDHRSLNWSSERTTCMKMWKPQSEHNEVPQQPQYANVLAVYGSSVGI